MLVENAHEVLSPRTIIVYTRFFPDFIDRMTGNPVRDIDHRCRSRIDPLRVNYGRDVPVAIDEYVAEMEICGLHMEGAVNSYPGRSNGVQPFLEAFLLLIVTGSPVHCRWHSAGL